MNITITPGPGAEHVTGRSGGENTVSDNNLLKLYLMIHLIFIPTNSVLYQCIEILFRQQLWLRTVNSCRRLECSAFSWRIISARADLRGPRGPCPQDAKSCNIIVITGYHVKTVCHNNVTHCDCTTTYLILSYTGFNKSRIVLLVLFLKPPSSLTPLLFLNLYTGSKSISDWV